MKQLLIVLFALGISQAFGQIIQQNIVRPNKVSGFVSAGSSSNLKKEETINQTNYSINGVLDFHGANRSSIRLSTGMVYDPNAPQSDRTRDYQLNDGYIAWRMPYQIRGGITMLHDYRLAIPLSQDSRESQSLYTRLSITPTFIFDLDRLMKLSNVSFIYKPYYIRSFHQYETQKINAVQNTRDSIVHMGVVEVALPNDFILNIGGNYNMAWDYNSVQKESTFSFWQDMTYMFNSKYMMTLGHSNGGLVYGPNGRDNNIMLFNKNTSTYYFAMTLYY